MTYYDAPNQEVVRGSTTEPDTDPDTDPSTEPDTEPEPEPAPSQPEGRRKR